jgi:maleate isomerase
MRFAYETDRPASKTVGLLILSSDETAEQDLSCLLRGGSAMVHTARVANDPEITSDTLAAMAHTIPAAAASLPGISFDAIGYACTSGTSVIGADRVHALVREGARTAFVTDPMTALISACRDLGITRLAFLSPYVAAVSDRLRGVLREQGISTPVFGSFEESAEPRVARIGAASVLAAGRALAADPAVEALFLSCTNLPTFDVIDALEAATGKPVLSSNLVLAWHLARLAGLPSPAERIGSSLSWGQAAL